MSGEQKFDEFSWPSSSVLSEAVSVLDVSSKMPPDKGLSVGLLLIVGTVDESLFGAIVEATSEV
jgi:hypothetical protein